MYCFEKAAIEAPDADKSHSGCQLCNRNHTHAWIGARELAMASWGPHVEETIHV